MFKNPCQHTITHPTNDNIEKILKVVKKIEYLRINQNL